MAGDASASSSGREEDSDFAEVYEEDDFAALLDEELAAISEEEEEDSDFNHRDKRQKLNDSCAHPSRIRGLCVQCGRMVDDDDVSAAEVALRYIHRDFKVGTEELARLRHSNLKSLLGKKKLCLVLDLDHTLLNSAQIQHTSPDERTNSENLFRLDRMGMLTKLRPFVETFLKEASDMFEMYIYTMGEPHYAAEMAKLLDPRNAYFESRVISRADSTKNDHKSLDVVLVEESAVVILDDTEHVWQKHQENLILMDRYHYFSSSAQAFGVKHKSSEHSGTLESILQALKKIHRTFFDLECHDDLLGRDVREIMKTVRREVLKGCKLVFSGLPKIGERADNQKLWRMAEELGATCCEELDSSVTHIISTNVGKEKSSWAKKHQRYLVHPSWIETANFSWERQPEELFC